MKYVKRFKPIESDPEIFTTLVHQLGVSEHFVFLDVLDCIEESNTPALALIVIFPESDEDGLRKATVEAEREHVMPENIKFLKQTIDNSCGLVAILHCVVNTVATEHISKVYSVGTLKILTNGSRGQFYSLSCYPIK
jgi:ubiquitin carboxyl-terminal hydrolase L3